MIQQNLNFLASILAAFVSNGTPSDQTTMRLTLLALAGTVLALSSVGCRPPAADLEEAYSEQNTGASEVDHSLLDKVLRDHVDAEGRVDYAKLHADREDLDAYLAVLKKTEFDGLGRDAKLVLLINAYNAFTLALILDHYPLKSINDIPDAKRWKARRWQVGALTLSLDEIENSYLRPKFREPRIHFAINCASIGCPPLRREAYRVKDIDKQLQDAATRMHNDTAWLELDEEKGTLRLTELYDWFHGDFEQVAGTTLEFAARFNTKLAAMLKAGKRPTVEFIDYDWSLNGRE